MPEHHDEDTIFKAQVALRESGLEEDQIESAIQSMQNYGILFRERTDDSNVARLFY